MPLHLWGRMLFCKTDSRRARRGSAANWWMGASPIAEHGRQEPYNSFEQTKVLNRQLIPCRRFNIGLIFRNLRSAEPQMVQGARTAGERCFSCF